MKYPSGSSQKQVEAYLEKHPDEREDIERLLREWEIAHDQMVLHLARAQQLAHILSQTVSQ